MSEKKTFKTGKQIQEEITARIKEIYENGGARVEKRWVNTVWNGLPMNASNGNTYNGYNIANLYYETMIRGHEDRRFMTLNQIKKLGLTLKPEQFDKGYYVLFSDTFDKPMTDGAGKPVLDDEGNPKIAKIPFLKYHIVYAGDQIEGMPPYKNVNYQHNTESLRQMLYDVAEKMGVKIKHGGNSCYYSPNGDYINMVEPQNFKKEFHYEATLFHELLHSTGHESRLNRPLKNKFGTAEYAYEEVSVEAGASYLSNIMGFDTGLMDEHAPYIASWAKSMDEKTFKSALEQGAKAAALIQQHMGIKHEPLLAEAYKPKMGDEVLFSGPYKDGNVFKLRTVQGIVKDVINDKDGNEVGLLLSTKGNEPDYFSHEDGKMELAHYLVKYYGVDAVHADYDPKMGLTECRKFWKGKDLDGILQRFGFDQKTDYKYQSLSNLAYTHAKNSGRTMERGDEDFKIDSPEAKEWKIACAHYLAAYGVIEAPKVKTMEEAKRYWSDKDIDVALDHAYFDDIVYTEDPSQSVERHVMSRDLRIVHDIEPLSHTKEFKAYHEYGRLDPVNSMEYVATHDGTKYTTSLQARGLPVHMKHDIDLDDWLTLWRKNMVKNSKGHLMNELTLPVEQGTVVAAVSKQEPEIVQKMFEHMARKEPWKGIGDPDNSYYKIELASDLSRMYGREVEPGKPLPLMGLEEAKMFWRTHSINDYLAQHGIDAGDVEFARESRLSAHALGVRMETPTMKRKDTIEAVRTLIDKLPGTTKTKPTTKPKSAKEIKADIVDALDQIDSPKM